MEISISFPLLLQSVQLLYAALLRRQQTWHNHKGDLGCCLGFKPSRVQGTLLPFYPPLSACCPNEMVGGSCGNLVWKWLGMERPPFSCCSEALGSMGRRKIMLCAQLIPLAERWLGAECLPFSCLSEAPLICIVKALNGLLLVRSAMESHQIPPHWIFPPRAHRLKSHRRRHC